jgi:hypothetical protein
VKVCSRPRSRGRRGIASLSIAEDDDLARAKPLVEEAREAIARGDVMTLEET